MANLDVDLRNGMDIVNKINQGFYANEICTGSGASTVDLIIPKQTLAPSQSILSDIFRAVGIQGQHAIMCWDEMEKRIINCAHTRTRFLGPHEKAYRSLRPQMKTSLALKGITDSPVSLPAPQLAIVIAAVALRKPRPFDYVTPTERNFVRLFVDMNVMHWLPIAIKVFERTKRCPFVIELDQEVEEPIVRRELWHGDWVWIVRTKRPDPNIYEAIIRDAIGGDTAGNDGMSIDEEHDTHDQSVLTIEEPDAHDQPLPSIEDTKPVAMESTPVDSANQPINTNTLREYARDMRRLGKRLASPDRETVNRVRKGIRKFADHVDRKDEDMESERKLIEFDRNTMLNAENVLASTPQAQKALDVYGHYKVL
ncbi:hypothetical protein ACHAPU_009336 [Fusarium lateritium]